MYPRQGAFQTDQSYNQDLFRVSTWADWQGDFSPQGKKPQQSWPHIILSTFTVIFSTVAASL